MRQAAAVMLCMVQWLSWAPARGAEEEADDDESMEVFSLDRPVDLDMRVHVKPHKLLVKELLKQLTSGSRSIFWGDQTIAVAARSKDGGLRFLMPAVRAATVAALQGHSLVGNVKELTEKDVPGRKTTGVLLEAAREKGADFLVLASVRQEPGRRVMVKLRLVDEDGETLATQDVEDAVDLRTGPQVMAGLQGLRNNLEESTRHLRVRGEFLPAGLALWLTRHPKEVRTVGLAVVAQVPELEAAVADVAQAALKSIQAREGVKTVELLDATGVHQQRTDAEWSAQASTRDLDAVVVVRIQPAPEDDIVETTLVAMDPQTEPLVRLVTRRGVVWALGTQDPDAVKQFERRAYRAQVRGFVTTYTNNNITTHAREDVLVLVNPQGNAMEPDEVLKAGVPEEDLAEWEQRVADSRMRKVADFWFCLACAGGLTTWATCLTAGTLCGLLILPVGLVSQAAASVAVGPPLLGLGGGLLGCLGVSGFIAIWGNLTRLSIPGGPATGPKLPAVARRHNLKLLQELQLDPVLLTPEYFEDPS